MKINEVKEMKEVVKYTEYIAEDGTIFTNEEECKKYDQSALCEISKRLKRLNTKPISIYDFNEEASDECDLEIFDIQTDEDVSLLKRYIYLKMQENGATENSIKTCFENEKRQKYILNNITPGHEVMIFWSYETDWAWIYNDGSLEGYFNYLREKYMDITKQKEEKKEN